MRKLVVMIQKGIKNLLYTFLLAFFCVLSLTAQDLPIQVADTSAQQEELINWMSVDELQEALANDQRKKIFLEVYTEWCGWCKRMNEYTLSQPHIAQYINENYYPIKFDAETQREIKFKDRVYKLDKTGCHEFATQFMDGQISYPTMVFLDEDLNIIQSIVGMKAPFEFEQIMTYFGADAYKSIAWQTYKKVYQSILETPRE